MSRRPAAAAGGRRAGPRRRAATPADARPPEGARRARARARADGRGGRGPLRDGGAARTAGPRWWRRRTTTRTRRGMARFAVYQPEIFCRRKVSRRVVAGRAAARNHVVRVRKTRFKHPKKPPSSTPVCGSTARTAHSVQEAVVARLRSHPALSPSLRQAAIMASYDISGDAPIKIEPSPALDCIAQIEKLKAGARP